jgi:subtilase family serine protease
MLSALTACALAANDGRHVLLSRDSAPDGWIVGDRAAPGAPVQFSVALEQQNLGELAATLEAVSDPDSSSYGKYLTSDEITALVAVPGSAAAVMEALGAVDVCEDLGDSLVCQTDAQHAEQMFNTSLFVFEDQSSSNKVIRTMGDMSIPTSIASQVEFVTGINTFYPRKKSRPVSVPAEGETGSLLTTPDTLRHLYNISSSASGKGAIIAVAEFEYQPILAPDTALFAKETGLAISVVKTVNPYPSSTDPAGTEGTLDAQYAGAAAVGADMWVWNQQGWMFEFSQVGTSIHSA